MTAVEPVAAGSLLHRRYRVVRLVGLGGMGAVYEAVDQLLDNTVALKQMLLDGPESDRAFTHEAKVLASLRHPSLPVVIDYFVEASGAFLVMQYIEGDDLSRFIEHQGHPCAVADVLNWANAILDALTYLHDHNPPVVHRDIKPANLRRTPRGEIVLLDFGLSKSRIHSDTTRTEERSTFGYTPRYAPPEQIDYRTTDARSDLYSLGATLYHLLAARAPSSATERLVALSRGEADPMIHLHLLNPDAGEALSDTIARALELRPERRFGSAAEMQTALRRVQSEKTEPAPIPAAEDARRVDAAMPAEVEVGKQTDLIVQVRFASSPVLGLEDWPTRRKPPEIEQGTEPIRLVYPIDARTGRLMPARVRINVVTSDFAVSGSSEHLVAVPPDEYSKRLGFLLTAQRSGSCRVNVEVSDPDGLFLGSIAMETAAVGNATPLAEWNIGNLVLEALRRPLAEIGNSAILAAHYELTSRTRYRHPDPPLQPTATASRGATPQRYEPAAPVSRIPDAEDTQDFLSDVTQLSSRELGELRDTHHAPAQSKRSRVGRLRALASTTVVFMLAVAVAWQWFNTRRGVSTPVLPPKAEQPIAAGPPAPALPPTDATPPSNAPPVTNRGPALTDPATGALARRVELPISTGLPPPSKSGKWLVEALATADESVASYYVKKLAAAGLPASLTGPAAGDTPRVYKVHIGRYENRTDAETVARRIEEYENLKCRVLQ